MKQLRSFSRNITIIPQGEGYVIANDLLLLSNASFDQRGKYRSESGPRRDHRTSAMGDSVVNDALVSRLSQQTGMNEKFSLQCLTECNFDSEKAVQMFNALHSKGGVPNEAFVK